MFGTLSFREMIYNYGRFHNNKVNQIIHFIFIPIIQFTLFILGALHWHTVHIGWLQGMVPEGNVCIETWAFALVVVIGYFIADKPTAIVTTLWSLAQLIASQHIVAAASANPDLFATTINGHMYQLKDVALYLHAGAWVAQFYGHGVHEGRAPALMTNVFYSLLAPFFVTFEFMNLIFGYKEDEMKDVRRRIETDVKEFKQRSKRE